MQDPDKLFPLKTDFILKNIYELTKLEIPNLDVYITQNETKWLPLRLTNIYIYICTHTQIYILPFPFSHKLVRDMNIRLMGNHLWPYIFRPQLPSQQKIK